ncbi:MAG: hypothetical protein V8Q84_12805 [Bilophila sp.]
MVKTFGILSSSSPLNRLGRGAQALSHPAQLASAFRGASPPAALIQEKLPHVSEKPLRFGDPAPTAPLGSWTLWEPGLILASARCSSPFPDGEVRFHENKIDPPSRAYLKLWETFTLLPKLPGPAISAPSRLRARRLDMGSGETLGAQVFSIDKAHLAPQVEAMPGVTHCIGSGFALDPRHAGAVDGSSPDMIGDPDRLYEVIMRWIALWKLPEFRLHPQFSGRNRPHHGGQVRGHSRIAGDAPFMQQARTDVGQALRGPISGSRRSGTTALFPEARGKNEGKGGAAPSVFYGARPSEKGRHQADGCATAKSG